MTSGYTYALLALIALGMVTAVLIWRHCRSDRGPIAATQPAKAREPATSIAGGFPPVPEWKPTIPVDIERTIATFAYYTNRDRVFVVFEHGTCVLVQDSSANPEAEATQLLDRVYKFHPDFNPQKMDDGNFLVSYSQPACSVVFADEFAANRSYIEANHLKGLVRDEVLLDAAGHANTFDERGKIGLYGRARMFMDAQAPKVVRVWRPVGT